MFDFLFPLQSFCRTGSFFLHHTMTDANTYIFKTVRLHRGVRKAKVYAVHKMELLATRVHNRAHFPR